MLSNFTQNSSDKVYTELFCHFVTIYMLNSNEIPINKLMDKGIKLFCISSL